jgi:hypothetical protein
MSKNKNKKKKKTVYIDDGRTIVDMSALGTGRPLGNSDLAPRASFKEQAKTYFGTVKRMILPMLATMGAITVAFALLYLVLELAA